MTIEPTVAVVATVLNEQPRLAEWLAALDAQCLSPDEIVVIDGGSADGTWDVLQGWAARNGATVRRAPGAGISEGRNLAISLTASDIIAVTDAGTLADPHWLERLVQAVSGGVDVAGGFFLPDLSTRWDRALAATTLPDVDEIDAARFQPSSRSLAFRRAWWEAGVRYPEWLDYCEDLVWDFAMRRAGARFQFVPDATVVFSVRPTPRAFAAQYYRYARGDGKAGIFATRHLARYATYCGATAILVRRRRSELVVAGLLSLAYMRGPVLRAWRRDRRLSLPWSESVGAIPVIAGLRALGDMAKMAGYPAGLCWRVRRFGGLGWRTTWRRISPAGDLWSPAALTRRDQQPTSSLAGVSREERP